jgi:sphinganine-1-phosphate aldolase
MKKVHRNETFLKRVKSRFFSGLLRMAKSIPAVRRKIERKYDRILRELEALVKPYRDRPFTFARLPEKGLDRESILSEIEELNRGEMSRWKQGFVSGAVYHGEEAHVEFLNRVYALTSQSNPLHSDVWPSTVKYEAEIVAMTAHMLGGMSSRDAADGGVCGTVTTGGTESILLSVKTYRDWARVQKGIKRPDMIIPVTAHAAFEKAAHYFGIRLVKIPVDSDYRADVKAARSAIGRNTILIVGSAPSFPHGIIDPIETLSELAREREIGFHTDACLGGFLLPWAERLGYRVPTFDFRLPGVTSISADTHKYGYSTKGTSVILYRTYALRRYQYFKTTEWPGGLYFSPTTLGSRPGGLIAACWAALITLGEKGYLAATDRILKTAAQIKRGITEIPELHLLGDPLWVIAFGSKTLDIYRIMEHMSQKGWSLNALHRPPCLHLCVTLRHTEEGIAERFIEDLRYAVTEVKRHPGDRGKMAPVYGMAARFPDRRLVADLLDRYVDLLYEA